jgi:putative salt-induced outer membrane protein YdiY
MLLNMKGCILMNYFFKKLILFILIISTPLLSKVDKDSKEKEVIHDIVIVHGMVLKGRITSLGAEKLSFKLAYCDGENHISYDDIDSIVTKYNYQISHNKKEIVGRVIGIVNNQDKRSLRVNVDGDIVLVNIDDVDNFIMSVKDNNSIENQIRNKLPYSKGNVNIGFEIENGTNQKNKLNLMMNLLHKKAENELHFFIDYAYETTQKEDDEKTQNKDEITVIVTDRYFYTKNDYYFASFMGEFDRPRHIQSRYAPSFGYGHKFRYSKSRWLQSVIGLGYISTQYTDTNLYDNDNYATATIGLNGSYQFENVPFVHSLVIDGGVLYYPSLTYPNRDWISRSNLNFTVPIFQFVSMKLAIEWINDSNPDPTVGNNKTTANLMFGIDF